MGHWLEEAEKEVKGLNKQSRSAGFLDRKMRIRKNYAAHAETYDNFIKKLNELIKRVNALPLDKKQPFGNIDSQSKESKLENHQYIYKSSKRFEKKVYQGSFLDLLKPKHLKHVRVLIITVSSQPGKVGLDIRDESMLKEKIVIDKDVVQEKKKYRDETRFHEYLHCEMSDLNDKMALKFLDWLAFKSEVYDLPFVEKKEEE